VTTLKVAVESLGCLNLNNSVCDCRCDLDIHITSSRNVKLLATAKHRLIEVLISDIASYVGISRSQLYRAFLEDFGISPHTYLQRYRINEACSLLRNPNYSIAEVAGSVGFNDPLYFSRVFKSIKQCPPSAYQREKKTK
jgi:AraC-like DNA-binding protein